MPYLSIIVPVYNTEKYLNQCVDSILDQDFKDFELWLVDDGSKDRSIDIIREYAAKDPRVKSAFIKGTGPAMPRNYGLNRAAGEYVLFVDSDDYLTEGALSSLVKVSRDYPEAVFVKGNQRVLLNDIEHHSVFASFRQGFDNKCIAGGDMMSQILKTDFVPCNNLIKKSHLEKYSIRFHEELPLLEDVPFIAEICARANTTVYSSQETYVYRLDSTTSLTRSKRTLAKTISLINVASYLKQIADTCCEIHAKELLKNRSLELAISGLSQSCQFLSKEDAGTALKACRDLYPKMPKRGTRGQHKFVIFMYNLSPILCKEVLRLTGLLKRKQ